ncbi:MAG: hypothetical protein LBU32_12345 [Clostridiales bacterium]|nr:hypothetical protein [Clostridiales bacterium]
MRFVPCAAQIPKRLSEKQYQASGRAPVQGRGNDGRAQGERGGLNGLGCGNRREGRGKCLPMVFWKAFWSAMYIFI